MIGERVQGSSLRAQLEPDRSKEHKQAPFEYGTSCFFSKRGKKVRARSKKKKKDGNKYLRVFKKTLFKNVHLWTETEQWIMSFTPQQWVIWMKQSATDPAAPQISFILVYFKEHTVLYRH